MLTKPCFISAKVIKPLPREPHIAYSYSPSEGQKNSEMLFVMMSTGLATLFTNALNK